MPGSLPIYLLTNPEEGPGQAAVDSQLLTCQVLQQSMLRMGEVDLLIFHMFWLVSIFLVLVVQAAAILPGFPLPVLEVALAGGQAWLLGGRRGAVSILVQGGVGAQADKVPGPVQQGPYADMPKDLGREEGVCQDLPAEGACEASKLDDILQQPREQ